MTAAVHWLQTTGDGVVVTVRLTPGARNEGVEGLHDGPNGPCLRARVRAVAEKGKANAALVALMAKWLGVPKSTVRVRAGGKARQKLIEVSGDPDRLSRRADELLKNS